MEKPKIVCYEMSDLDYKKLEKLCLKFKFDIKKAEFSEYSLPIAATVSDVFPILPYFGEKIPEPMLVFANFPEEILKFFLSEMRKYKIAKGSLKAMLTRYNADWMPLQLYKELCREREAILQNKSV